MSVDSSQSNSLIAHDRGYGCCSEDWEKSERSSSDKSGSGDGQVLPQYYLPCTD